MKDTYEYAVLITVSGPELARCTRLMDLNDLLTDKFLEARREADRTLIKEVFGDRFDY